MLMSPDMEIGGKLISVESFRHLKLSGFDGAFLERTGAVVPGNGGGWTTSLGDAVQDDGRAFRHRTVQARDGHVQRLNCSNPKVK